MPENPRIEELRRRVQADPASIAFAALAEEFRRTGRYQDAIETCRTRLQRHPAYLSARVTLGRALIEVGGYEAAREELQTVLRSAPENLAAIRGIEQINEHLGQSTEMHPDLHEIVREPIRLAAEKPPKPAEPVHAFELPVPPPAPAAALDLTLSPEPEPPSRPELNLDSLELSLSLPEPPLTEGVAEPVTGEPFDILSAALKETSSPTFTPSLYTFASSAPDAAVDGQNAPVAGLAEHVPHVAATLTRLEQFLGAIESARHA